MKSELIDFFKERGIYSQHSCPYTPEENGVVERKNWHVLETTLALLDTSNVPKIFWVEAIQTSVYLINRHTITINKDDSPYSILFGKLPDYSHLKVFGCVVFCLFT